MKYEHVYALFLMVVFHTSCGGQNKPDPPKEKIKSEIKDVSTSGLIDTKYEYTDSGGKNLIIQNSFPKGEGYTDPNGKEYFKTIFWTQIINETFDTLKVTIDFPLDSFEIQSSSGAYRKLLLPPNTMTIDKNPLFDYGLNLKSFLDNNRNKPSSLKRTINPKESSGFYVVSLFIKSKSGWPTAKSAGGTRAGFSLKGQNLFYRINDNEIHCGRINLKNLILKNQRTSGI